MSQSHIEGVNATAPGGEFARLPDYPKPTTAPPKFSLVKLTAERVRGGRGRASSGGGIFPST